MEYLGKAETMLLLKVIKEESRWSHGAHRYILGRISEKMSAKAEDGMITQVEFEQAYLEALTDAVEKMSGMVKAEIDKEYGAMGQSMQRM